MAHGSIADALGREKLTNLKANYFPDAVWYLNLQNRI